MKKFIALIFLILGAGAFYVHHTFVSEPNPTLKGEVIIDVEPGSNFRSILRKLKEAQIEIPELPAKVMVRILKLDKKVKVGEYRLTPPLSSLQILEAVTNGRGISRNLLVKEGYNRWDIRTSWSALPYFKAQEFDALMKDPELIKKMRIPSEAEILGANKLAGKEGVKSNFRSLEGFLFPETYSIQKYDSVKSVVLEMLTQFDGRARDILSRHPWAKDDLGFYRLLTLASVVEKESGNGEEQPIVASVFWNRLKIKMPLQSDPTTIYGIMPNFDGNLTRVHLRAFSMFNTYRIPELPVGPICNPGEKALRAVLSPAATPYLYFVSRGDGSHVFAEDYKTHNKNVREFQLKIKDSK